MRSLLRCAAGSSAGVVSSALNWAGSIHAAATKSTSPTRVFLFQSCFNCPCLSPLRQAIRKEQGGIRAWAASSCDEQEHVVPGFQGCLYAVEVIRRSDRMMVDAQNDIPMLNAQLGSKSARLDVHHQDALFAVQMELVNELLGLIACEALH